MRFMPVSLTTIVVVLAVLTVPGTCIHKASRFKVDLDTPPEERWDRIFKQYDIAKFNKIATEIVE